MFPRVRRRSNGRQLWINPSLCLEIWHGLASQVPLPPPSAKSSYSEPTVIYSSSGQLARVANQAVRNGTDVVHRRTIHASVSMKELKDEMKRTKSSVSPSLESIPHRQPRQEYGYTG